MAAVFLLVLLIMLPDSAHDLGGTLRRTLRDDYIEPPLAPIPARTPVGQLCAGSC